MSVNANTTTTLSPEYLNAYRGTGLLAVAIFFIPLLLIFVGLRFYCRHLTRTKWGVDDYLVLASLFCQIGASVIAICKQISKVTLCGVNQSILCRWCGVHR